MLKKNKKILINSIISLITLSPIVLSSACNIEKIKQPEKNDSEPTVNESIIQRYENNKANYQPLSDWYFDILKKAYENYYDNWNEDTKQYFDNLFISITQSNINQPVKETTLPERIKRIQSPNFVYSKTQDFLDNNPNNVINYDFKAKFKNQEVNYQEGLNLTAKELLNNNPNPDYQPKPIYPTDKDSLIKYLNQQIESHWRKVSIDKNYYQSEQFYDSREKVYRSRFAPWTSITTDLKYYYVKNPLEYYNQGNSSLSVNEIQRLVPSEDVSVKHQFNYAFENANLRLSHDPNAYNDINSRNVRLFNRGQGTILYADNDKALILTAKHVLRNLLNREGQFLMDRTYNITFYDKDLSTNNISFKNTDLKVIYKSKDRRSNHIYRNYDQALIEVKIKNKIDLSNNRAYLNPMKLNYDASYNDSALANYINSNNYYMTINNQGYFLNQDLNNNLKNYQTLKLDTDYPNPFKTLDKYLAQEHKYIPKLDDLTLARRFYNQTEFRSNSFITPNNIQRVTDWIDNRQSKVLFKGWNDNEINNSDDAFGYTTPILGLNYDQNEYFNLYDIQTNQAYYTSSNLWINIRELTDEHEYSRGGHIVKIYLGHIKPGNSGQGFFNTKYEISNQIRNEISNNNDKNLNLNNYHNANKSKRTDIVAYDELKYILIGGITYYENFEQEVDKNNIPIGLQIAEPVAPDITKKYNDYLNDLINNAK